MNRRTFMEAAAAGPAVAVAAAMAPASQAGQPARGVARIDPDELAAAAVRHFLPGKLTCGEALLKAACEALDIRSDLVPDAALGLAGGVGLQGKTCGCVTGPAVVLGLAIGRQERQYKAKKMRTLKAAGAYCKRFEEKFGTVACRKISGLDLTTPEGREKLASHVKADTCSKVVETAARMLAESLATA